MIKPFKRNRKRLVDTTGYVKLSEACVRANQTGFFGLSQRVNPESFDGKDTNIDPRQCFMGGRRVELALAAKDAETYATRAAASGSDNGTGTDSGESTQS